MYMKNTKLFKLLAVVIAVIMVVGVMAACSKATDADKGVTEAVADAANNADNGDSDDTIYRTLDQIKKSGSIKIGVFSDKNPFGSPRPQTVLKRCKPVRLISSLQTSPSPRSAHSRSISLYPT